MASLLIVTRWVIPRRQVRNPPKSCPEWTDFQYWMTCAPDLSVFGVETHPILEAAWNRVRYWLGSVPGDSRLHHSGVPIGVFWV